MSEQKDSQTARCPVAAAHPDDAEFVCGGTLCRLADAGWEIHIATASPGDCGSLRAVTVGPVETWKSDCVSIGHSDYQDARLAFMPEWTSIPKAGVSILKFYRAW